MIFENFFISSTKRKAEILTLLQSMLGTMLRIFTFLVRMEHELAKKRAREYQDWLMVLWGRDLAMKRASKRQDSGDETTKVKLMKHTLKAQSKTMMLLLFQLDLLMLLPQPLKMQKSLAMLLLLL